MINLIATFGLLVAMIGIWLVGWKIDYQIKTTSGRYTAFLAFGLAGLICGLLSLIFIAKFFWPIIFAK